MITPKPVEPVPVEKVNPCKGGTPEADKPPIWTALADIGCEGAKVQSAADITVGSIGELPAMLSPIKADYGSMGMCPVNVHWHTGAEHRNTGTYDIPGEEWMAEYGHADHHRRALSGEIEPGNFCPGYDPDDPAYTSHYDWKYCTGMDVGYTYEIHWPHSNLGACDTEWQYQSHFMDGVLCKANEGHMAVADAAAAVFSSPDDFSERGGKLGVQGQVFTVVNDPAYDYPEWDILKGWNAALATDVAVYQGSTTGQQEGNEICRGTGGMVTWQVDRGCHKISAAAFDRLCMEMSMQADDMSADMGPHNARETTEPFITVDVTMTGGMSAADLGY